MDWTATGGSWLPALDSVAWRLRKTLERSDLTSGHREVANPGPLDSSSVKRLKADVNGRGDLLFKGCDGGGCHLLAVVLVLPQHRAVCRRRPNQKPHSPFPLC